MNLSPHLAFDAISVNLEWYSGWVSHVRSQLCVCWMFLHVKVVSLACSMRTFHRKSGLVKSMPRNVWTISRKMNRQNCVQCERTIESTEDGVFIVGTHTINRSSFFRSQTMWTQDPPYPCFKHPWIFTAEKSPVGGIPRNCFLSGMMRKSRPTHFTASDKGRMHLIFTHLLILLPARGVGLKNECKYHQSHY